MNKFIIVYGDIFDGFTFVGPFDDHEVALAYAQADGCKPSWHITELETPDTP